MAIAAVQTIPRNRDVPGLAVEIMTENDPLGGSRS
jgi:hypothetical protein